MNVDGSGVIGAGFSGAGTMRVSDGRNIESTFGYIGYKSGSTGEVTVGGAGSTWTSGNRLYVGYSGEGTLNIINGGEVKNSESYIGYKSGSTGEVTVDGIGSGWTSSNRLVVGNSGEGTLNIINGGEVNNGYGSIGEQPGSTGKVLVSGIGSTWINSSNLTIGRYGSGTLNITNGGKGSSNNGSIGLFSGVTVDGVGSTWAISGSLTVGGRLNITNGGLVSVAEKLTIREHYIWNGFMKMGSGGMLALYGKSDESLDDFFGLIEGVRAIYFEGDYMLSYMTEGDLAGYTVLTVLADVPVLGDINGDGVVDGIDVDPFVTELLTDGPYNPVADINGDGTVDGFDVDPFVALVIGGDAGAGGAPVPEPCMLVLMGVGGLVLVRKRK